jgi:cation diffusion facilitator family transporter
LRGQGQKSKIFVCMDFAAKEKNNVAAISVGAALFLTAIKLVIGLLTRSLGILAEAAHSGLDLLAALITLLAVRYSDKPADRDHPYGHGKIESFSALIETGLLFITCAWIVWEAVQRMFFHYREIDPSLWAFLVMAISIGVDINRSRILTRAALKYHSQALEADALHFSTDIWSSAVVIIGLAVVWLGQNVFPGAAGLLGKADAAAAMIVAFIVLFVSYRLGRRTVDVLLDRAPDGLAQKFSEAAGGIEGVLNVSKVRVRRSGPQIFVDMNVEVDRNLTVEQTHGIVEAVETAVQKISAGTDIVIHTDPREAERESMAKRIRAVAHRNQMGVHNICLHEDKGQVIVDLHLEVDDHLALHQAHDLASHIERDLRADMPEISRVNTHIESRGTGMGDSQDVTGQEPALVGRIRKLTERIGGRACCHEITVHRQGSRLLVSLHCSFDSNLSIVQVHAITTRIEESLKKKIPALERVLVHAEPDAQ